MNTETAQYIERVNRLMDEVSDLKEDIKEIYAEAKSKGYDVSTLRKAVKVARKGYQKYSEEQDLLDTYLADAGIIPSFDTKEVA